ncbi:hypothetical protein KL918_002248 [Ogataea parapolymorpha]|uniref:RRM domain-containing protein n=1 Tax=Ogataea parapolymorpha (strain ATCC 26012 / BCRC 20466 / JCM 22074 / NRRL Y-7560 / DL-1) TaxID=871575 RepID=W1QJV3_OGAPD|nr:hypothetical protein HPODL_02288 [Ogataea parapolymorpha DL-1]ESX02978.1 hypothetical protein HPODL_02288 [Ogataea parapolymorpha DL-1]KAG7867651.1 hypothetical protein KL918_002248 [Ogataea parapolymorpha]KAG7871639.1 hypothetical protein KL916_003739 [Ogataea parapolymorpha]
MSASEVESAQPVTEQSPSPVEETDPNKVFVGNLPYDTTEDQLKALTPELEVVSVELPTRTVTKKTDQTTVELQKGHGFIVYKSSEDAAKAIELIGGKTVGEREVYARAALPPSLAPKRERKPKKTAQRSAASSASGKTKKKSKAKAKTESKPSGSESDAKSDSKEASPADQSESTSAESAAPVKKARKPVLSKEEKQKKLSEGVPSKTTLFLGNLDKSVTSKDLKELFAEYEPVWIRVPRRELPKNLYLKLKARNVQIDNKGIAFVRFKSEEDQQKALKEFENKEYKNRKLNVTVAIDSAVEAAAQASSEGKENE